MTPTNNNTYVEKLSKVKIASVYRGQHASGHVISLIFCVILSRRTSSTPPSSALKIGEISMAEIGESESNLVICQEENEKDFLGKG